MRIPCAVCDYEMPRVQLYRVGDRLMCRRCWLRLEPEPRSDTPSAAALTDAEVASVRRRDLLLTVLLLTAKIGFFLLIFHWATVSETGAGALDGIVLAEMVTWISFTLMDLPFRGIRITAGLVFELGLAFTYFRFDEPFPTDGSNDHLAAAFVAFGMFAMAKGALWAVETVLETSGIKDGE